MMRCLVLGHEWMHPRIRRDRSGALVRGAVDMTCSRCAKEHQSDVDLTPHWPMLARLRRQIPWSRARSRERAS